MRNFILGVIVVIIIVVVGGLVFALTGFVNTNSDQSPGAAETWLASHAMDASMEKHAPHMQSPIPATDANLMPHLLECARAHATEGEIVEALQAVWGSYTEVPVF